MKEHEQFGKTITGSRWFNQEPEIVERPVRTFEQRWLCPMDECSGQMVYNGMSWPMNPPGYHHTCSECGFTAAIHGKRYPLTTTRSE